MDFSCFFILFAAFAPAMPTLQAASLGFLAYNVVAFGLQPFFGYLCDARPRFPAAPLGAALLLAALALVAFPVPALALAALGNALFHVGGGVDALAGAQGRMARSGVFVSSGALGVALGTLAGRAGGGFLWLPIALTALALLGCLLARRKQAYGRTLFAFFGTAAARPLWLVLALCLVSIVIRAYGGGIVPLPWRTTALLGLLPAASSFLGKAAGGFLADRFGARTVGMASLLLSIPLLCLGNHVPATALLGLLLFNINMPITLCAVGSSLPRNPGLAFGLTTLALLCGTIPLFFFTLPHGAAPLVMAGLTAASALCLLLAVRNQPRKAGAATMNIDFPRDLH